jgi:hypothetical protein
MRKNMYKVGIIGHSPEHFSLLSENDIKKVLRKTIEVLDFQYGTDLIINTVGDIGIGLWAAEECIDIVKDCNKALHYHIFLPYVQEITCEYWYPFQQDLLKKCCERAYSITTCEEKRGNDHARYDLVKDSNFIVCYWTGKKQGKTFDAIKQALQCNKIVLDGFNELKLITNNNIKK